MNHHKILLLFTLIIFGTVGCQEASDKAEKTPAKTTQTAQDAPSKTETNTSTSETITDESAPEIEWMTWEEGEKKAAAGDKKVVVFVHDPSCESCKEMKEKTLGHPEIRRILAKDFYCIMLSGQRKEPITTRGTTFTYKEGLNTEGYHSLAQAITQSKESITYPTICMLDENMDLFEPAPGKIPPYGLEPILHYMATDDYKNISFAEFQKTFEPKIPVPVEEQ